jgi:hypothetical protein
VVFGLASVGLAALGGAVGVLLATLGYAIGNVSGLRKDRDAIPSSDFPRSQLGQDIAVGQ